MLYLLCYYMYYVVGYIYHYHLLKMSFEVLLIMFLLTQNVMYKPPPPVYKPHPVYKPIKICLRTNISPGLIFGGLRYTLFNGKYIYTPPPPF